MRGLVLAVFVSATAACAAPCSIDGTWDGVMQPQVYTLHVTMDIATANGVSSGKFVNIDAGNATVQISSAKCEDDQVTLELSSGATHIAGYQAELSADRKSMKGTWSQGNEKYPMSLSLRAPGQSGYVLKRPQEPHPPYPYREEEVTFDGPAGIKIAGTLTLPQGRGPFPAVILVLGSGPYDRDENVLGHKKFLLLADYLTRRGIAVLRSDKRGVGRSTGNYGDATTLDFAEDTKAAVRFLKSRADVDRRHIGLIGHSEGGMIAPVVASQDRSIAFIVLLAGAGVTGEDLLIMQQSASQRLAGTSETDIAQTEAITRRLYDAARKGKDGNEARANVEAAFQEIAPTLPKEEREAQANATASNWIRAFLVFDPAVYLKKVKCPVLALNGSKDVQVPATENLAGIRAALAGHRDVDIEELPGINHMLQTAKTGALEEYTLIEETIAPLVLEKIAAWVARHAR